MLEKNRGLGNAIIMNLQLIDQTLNMVLESYLTPGRYVPYSSRCHDTSRTHRQLLWRFHLKQSLSRCGNNWDTRRWEEFLEI